MGPHLPWYGTRVPGYPGTRGITICIRITVNTRVPGTRVFLKRLVVHRQNSKFRRSLHATRVPGYNQRAGLLSVPGGTQILELFGIFIVILNKSGLVSFLLLRGHVTLNNSTPWYQASEYRGRPISSGWYRS
eukprot:308708-Rhodomonas_salina.1